MTALAGADAQKGVIAAFWADKVYDFWPSALADGDGSPVCRKKLLVFMFGDFGKFGAAGGEG